MGVAPCDSAVACACSSCCAAPALRAVCSLFSVSFGIDVCMTVPPYLATSGTTLSTVELRTSTKIAELLGCSVAVKFLGELVVDAIVA